MNAPVRIPAPPSAIVRTLSRFDRDQLAGFIAVAIDLLDVADGDPDAEEIGLEDSFQAYPADGPGCDLTDPGGQRDEDDLNTGLRFRSEWANGPGCEIADAGGQCDEDGVNTSLDVLWERRGAGCTVSDDDTAPYDDGEAVR